MKRFARAFKNAGIPQGASLAEISVGKQIADVKAECMAKIASADQDKEELTAELRRMAKATVELIVKDTIKELVENAFQLTNRSVSVRLDKHQVRIENLEAK